MSDPTPGTFRARAERRPDGVLIVAEGELDLVGAPALAAALPDGGTDAVIVDMAGVGFMDSSGLRALLEARNVSLEAGRSFALARPSLAVIRVLELVDLAREFEVVEV